MKTIRCLTMTLAALAACVCLAAKPATKGAKPGVWTMDCEAAKKLAVEKNLPILFNFTGSDWCGWCKILDDEVFSKKDFKEYAKDNLVLVWVDFPNDKKLVPKAFVEQNQKLKSEFGVRGYPSLFITGGDTAEKIRVARKGKEETPETFIASLKAAVGQLTPKQEAEKKPEAEKTDGKVMTQGAAAGVWTMDQQAAKKLAAEKKLPILINFTGSDWCGWCKLMDREVFSKDEWQTYAKDNLVLLWIDFPNKKSLVPAEIAPKNAELAQAFGVQGYPTYHLVGSDGETRIKQFGARRNPSPEWFIGAIKAALTAE